MLEWLKIVAMILLGIAGLCNSFAIGTLCASIRQLQAERLRVEVLTVRVDDLATQMAMPRECEPPHIDPAIEVSEAICQ